MCLIKLKILKTNKKPIHPLLRSELHIDITVWMATLRAETVRIFKYLLLNLHLAKFTILSLINITQNFKYCGH